jgi:hypothetical protein
LLLFMSVRDLEKHDHLSSDDNFEHEATGGSVSPSFA